MAQLASVFVEGRFEPAVTQHATLQPLRRQLVHLGDQQLGIETGIGRRPEQFERPRRTAPFGQGRAFEHHGAGISAGHRQIGRIRAGIHPAALAQRPAVTWGCIRLPALHRDHFAIDIELQRGDEPARQFAHGQTMPHRQRAGTDEALPACAQQQTFDRPAGGIGPVEYPHRLAAPGRRFEHVAQRGDEGVDAAAEVLQVDQQHVEGRHHGLGRTAHFAVKAEDRDAMQRVDVVRRLDHVVLLVAAQAVLRTEGGGQLEVGQGGQRIERVRQVAGQRSRVGKQGDALAGERATQRGLGEKAIQSEVDGGVHGHRVSLRAKPSRWWKSGCGAGWASAQ